MQDSSGKQIREVRQRNRIPDWISEQITLDALAISTRPCIVPTPSCPYRKILGFQSTRLYLSLTANATLERPLRGDTALCDSTSLALPHGWMGSFSLSG